MPDARELLTSLQQDHATFLQIRADLVAQLDHVFHPIHQHMIERDIQILDARLSEIKRVMDIVKVEYWRTMTVREQNLDHPPRCEYGYHECQLLATACYDTTPYQLSYPGMMVYYCTFHAEQQISGGKR